MIRKKIVIGIMCATLALSSISAYADSYENSKSFSGVVLPETSGNTTLASVAKKTTSRKYGRAKISSYTNCSKVSCWYRTTISDGTVHYWLPYMVTISDKSYHKINYCDKDAAYYKSGVKAELRAENATEALDLKTEKVSGNVDFN
jgi:hypothetical protein